MLLTRVRIEIVPAVLLAGLFSACYSEPTGVTGGLSSYDPGADPATNPESLFEPFPVDEPERADTEATMVRYSLDKPTTLNPIFILSWTDGFLYELLFDPITHRNAELLAIWNPNVVAEAETLEGGLVHRVHLHPGLRWHDGEPLTSHDVRFTWEVLRDDSVPNIDFKYKVAAIDDIRVLDDETFEVHHSRLVATALDNLYYPILPRHLLGDPQERAADPTMRAGEYFVRYQRELGVGNGPFRFVEWVPGDRIVLERWEAYPFEKPAIKRHVITSQPDRNTALLQFRQGSLDDIWLTVQQHGSQTSGEDFRSVGVKAWSPRWMQAYVGWNLDGSNPFFGDVRVRQAMAHAYDRERVLRTVTWNLYTASNGMFGPTHWSHNSEIELVEYDLERAAELLDEAGWLVEPDDGFRYKTVDGEPVRFHFVMSMPSSFVDAIRVADILREDLLRLGVTFDTETQDNATHVRGLIQHEHEGHIGTHQVFSDPDIWRNFLHSVAIDHGRNYNSYSNPRVDELFSSTEVELDRERRTEMFREIQRLVFEDHAVLWLWEYSTTWGFSKRMRGVELAPSGVTAFRPGTRAWWIER